MVRHNRPGLRMGYGCAIALLVLWTGVGAQTDSAQSSSSSCPSAPSEKVTCSGEATNAQAGDTAPQIPETTTGDKGQPPQVRQTLDGEPVFEVKAPRGQFLYGGRLIGGYDSAAIGPNSTQNSTEFLTYDGYLGGALQTQRSFFLLQQDFFGNQYSGSSLPNQYLFQTSALAGGDWNRRANWQLEGHTSVGNGALLFLAPLPSTLVGKTPAALPGSAALGLDNSLALYPDLSGRVSLNVNPATVFTLYAKDSYRAVFDDNTHENVALFRPSVLWSTSPRSTIGVYGLSTRETGDLDCRSNGGGLEFSRRLTHGGYLDMWGGPQFSSNGCTRKQTFEFHLQLAKPVTPTVEAYLMANRESGNTLVRGSEWEDNASVGIRKQGRSTLLSVDAGYVSGVQVGSSVRYQGTFASLELRKRISKNLLVSGAYRRFDNNETAPALHGNVVLFSLIFSPLRRSRTERRGNSGEPNE